MEKYFEIQSKDSEFFFKKKTITAYNMNELCTVPRGEDKDEI